MKLLSHRNLSAVRRRISNVRCSGDHLVSWTEDSIRHSLLVHGCDDGIEAVSLAIGESAAYLWADNASATEIREAFKKMKLPNEFAGAVVKGLSMTFWWSRDKNRLFEWAEQQISREINGRIDGWMGYFSEHGEQLSRQEALAQACVANRVSVQAMFGEASGEIVDIFSADSMREQVSGPSVEDIGGGMHAANVLFRCKMRKLK